MPNESFPPRTSGDVAFKLITVTLNNAQFKALPTTPVELIPAPGAGKLIRVLDLIHDLDATAGAYTGPEETAIWLKTGTNPNVINGSDYQMAEAFIFPVGTRAIRAPNVENSAALETLTADVNQPLLLVDTDNAEDYAGGHADNTLKTTVAYYVIDLAG